MTVPAFAAIPTPSAIVNSKAYNFEYIKNNAGAMMDIASAIDNKSVIVKPNEDVLMNPTTNTWVDASTLPAVEYYAADGSVTKYAAGDGDVLEELTVVSVSAVNKTTIRVYFSNGDIEEITVAPMSEGENNVTFQYEGKTFTETVEYSAAKVTATVDFLNYRHIQVTFSDVVDGKSAKNAANYYFEIVDGNAAFSAVPTLQESNQLSKIETTYPGGAAKYWENNIKVSIKGGRTVVDIHLPEDARFTNWLDEDLKEDDGIDDERTLAVKQRTLTGYEIWKYLTKDVDVNVAIRNVLDKNGNASIDVAVDRIHILDEVRPILLGVSVVEKEALTYDVKGFGRELGDYTLYRTNPERPYQIPQQIEFYYSEPVFDAHELGKSDTEQWRDVKLYVNGKFIASTLNGNLDEYVTFAMDRDADYEDARKVLIDVEKAVHAAPNEEFILGKYYNIHISGITDLAGNIEEASDNKFRVKFADMTMPEPDPITFEMPIVLDIAQVADNMFRIEFNRADVEGTLVIENPDGEGVGLLEADVPKSVKDGNKYYSYVAVPAIDNEELNTILYEYYLAYDGMDYINRVVRVEDVVVVAGGPNGEDLLGDNYQETMKLVNDILSPVVEINNDQNYDDYTSIIRIPVMDIVPWEDDNILYDAFAVRYIYNPSTMRFMNRIDATNVEDHYGYFGEWLEVQDSDQFLPIIVSYVDKAGATHRAVVTNYDVRPDSGPPEYLNPGFEGSIGYDDDDNELVLELWNYPQLLDADRNLVSDVTYKVEIPAGYFTDPSWDTNFGDDIDFEYGGEEYDMLYVDDARVERWLYRGTSVTDWFEWWYIKQPIQWVDFWNYYHLGYTSKAQTAFMKIIPPTPKDPDPIPPEVVPQTSKELIRYDEPTNSLWIEFTGTINIPSIEDENNYKLNGKTIAEWNSFLGTNVEVDYVVDNSDPENIRQYAVFEIPQDSIEESGDVPLVVSGVSNNDGGTMTTVTTVVRLHDNYRPVVLDAEIMGQRQIKLTFNEPIRYHVDPVVGADKFSAAKNFKAYANGVELTVLEAVLPAVSGTSDRELTLNLGSNIPEEETIYVEVVEDQNGNILIIDKSPNKNPMKLDIYECVR